MVDNLELQLVQAWRRYAEHLAGQHNQKSHAGGGANSGLLFKTREDANEYGQEHFSEWRQSLSREDARLIDGYTGTGYRQINGFLRGNYKLDPDDDEDLIDEINEKADRINAAIKSSTIPHQLTVFRGLELDNSAIDEGDEIIDNAFVSTSLAQSGANQFSRNAVVKINIPAGSKGAYVSFDDWGSDPDEAEILLPKNSRFKVLSKTKTDDDKGFGNIYEYELELIDG